MGASVFFLAWLALNIGATRALRRAAAMGLERPGMQIAMVWIAPFIGAVMAWADANRVQRAYRQAERDAARFDTATLAPAPASSLTLPGGQVLSLDECFEQLSGFPLLNWEGVDVALAELDPADRAAAHTACQRLWLEHMRHALGPRFQLMETETAWVLSSLDDVQQRAAASYIGNARKKVSQLLAGLAAFPAEGKSILLVLDDEDWYYHYVSVYYPSEGEFAFSGGMFIDAGCPHFVVRRADLAQIEPVIAHEITHSALAHLALPLWLDEGIAVNTERHIAGKPPSLHTPFELDAMHRRFWGPAEIQQFWSGASFRRTDEGNLLSYELARVLVEQMARDWTSFTAFVQEARREDAGAASAAQHLHLELGAAAAALTGSLDSAGWAPPAAEGTVALSA